MKVSGYVCASNSTKLDYMLRESALSLLPVCEEVVLSIGPSEDDTRAIAEQLCREDNRFRILDYQISMPVRDLTWWTTWLNWTRELLQFPMQLSVDADEVLCPGSYEAIREAADAGQCRWMHRLNFWCDITRIAPHGRVCGEQVVRLAPTDMWMCSDEPHYDAEVPMRLKAGWPPCATPEMRIFHYGFLRRNQALFDKVKAVNGAFFGGYDDRLERAEKEGVHWSTYCDFDRPMLEHFEKDHPPVAHDWLRSHGFDP